MDVMHTTDLQPGDLFKIRLDGKDIYQFIKHTKIKLPSEKMVDGILIKLTEIQKGWENNQWTEKVIPYGNANTFRIEKTKSIFIFKNKAAEIINNQ